MNVIYQFFIRVSAFVTKEIREVLRQPWLVVSLILGPFLILALFGIGYLAIVQACGWSLVRAPLSAGAGWDGVWLAGLTLLAAPLCEEFIFRGLIQSDLRRSLPA